MRKKLLSGESYCGHILNGEYTKNIKKRIIECVETFYTIDKLDVPLIPYLAAWRDSEKAIWYEYVGTGLLDLLSCEAPDAAEVFRKNIIKRRIYKYIDAGTVIREEVVNRQELNNGRQALREASKNVGMIDAVYKITISAQAKPIWLKDQATIEFHALDKICLSLGSLTIVTKEMEAEEEREKLVLELQDALANIKTLRGFLPICASCKKIRDDKGYWNQIENYISTHTEVDFSHGICPDCVKKLYPEYDIDSE